MPESELTRRIALHREEIKKTRESIEMMRQGTLRTFEMRPGTRQIDTTEKSIAIYEEHIRTMESAIELAERLIALRQT